jgi:hypothetical protein
MIYHGRTSFLAGRAELDPKNTVAGLLCVMEGVKSGLHIRRKAVGVSM